MTEPTKLNPNEAPPGYKAVEYDSDNHQSCCGQCVFNMPGCPTTSCIWDERGDKTEVFFVAIERPKRRL